MLGQNVRVMYTPAKHWTTRGITDKNKSLWGSWAIWEVHPERSVPQPVSKPELQPEPEPGPRPEIGAQPDDTGVQVSQPIVVSPSRPLERVGLALWFSGDTGYCDVFETIGAYFRWRFGRPLPFSLAIIGIGACKWRNSNLEFWHSTLLSLWWKLYSCLMPSK